MDTLSNDTENLLLDAWEVLQEDDVEAEDLLDIVSDSDGTDIDHETLHDQKLATTDILPSDPDDDESSGAHFVDLLQERVTSARNGEHPAMTSVSYFTSILSRTGIHGPRHLQAYNLKRRAVKIGKGAQFTVYKEIYGNSFGNDDLVIKRVNVPLSRTNSGSFASGPEYRAQLRALELEILALCHSLLRNHRNIVNLVAWGYDYPIPDTPVPVLFVEAALMTLDDFLKSDSRDLSEQHSVDIKYQLALDVTAAIEALHRLHIAHGDIKPENVLVFVESQGNGKVPFCAKISDFGVCIDMENPVRKLTTDDYRGTSAWLAPEVRDQSFWEVTPFEPEIMFRFDAYSLGLVILSIFTNKGEPVELKNAEESRVDVAIRILRETRSISPQLRMQLTKALRGLLAEDPWKRSLPSVDLLKLDTPAFAYWLALSRDVRKSTSRAGIIDPAHNIGPLFWYRLDQSVLVELEQQYNTSKSDPTLHHAGDVLFGMAQSITGAKPSYLDRLLTYVTESARSGYSPARAVYAQIMHAHGQRSRFDDQVLDRWLLRAVAEGYMFAKPSPNISEEQLEEARQRFRDTGGFCTDPFTRMPVIIDAARSRRKALEWQMSGKKVVDNRGNTLLHAAAALGAIDVVRLLVEEAHVPVDVPNDNFESPLYKAFQAGHPEVIQYLLDQGAKASTATRQESLTALHWLFTIPESFIREIATRMIREAGASINATMVPAIGDNGVSYPQRLSMTHFPFELPLGAPLHWACFARNKPAMKVLLDLGADINATYHASDIGTTPLSLAAWWGEVDVAQFLLSKGADGRARDSKDRNTLHHMTLHLPEWHGSMPHAWHYWIRHGNWDEHLQQTTGLAKSLMEGGAELDARDQVYPRSTPIVMASSLGIWDGGATCALLSVGANIDGPRGSSGDTVLHQWVHATGPRLAYPDSYLYVLERMVEKMGGVDLRNDHVYETALHVLVGMYHSEAEFQAASEILFAHNPPPDVNMADRHGLSPLHIALDTEQEEQNPELRAFYLIGKGADLFHHTSDGKDILYRVANNKTLSDQRSHYLILRLLSHLVEREGGDVQRAYQKHFLPHPGAILTLAAAANAGRVKTTELLLNLGLERDINKSIGTDSIVTVLDDALSWAERGRQQHIDLLAAYNPGIQRERATAAQTVYDTRQGKPTRAAEAYAGLPGVLRLLRARGAKRACELEAAPALDSSAVDFGVSQSDLWDMTHIYWMGYTPETQPNRKQWEIVYELSRLPSELWRDQVVRLLREMYEAEMWRPDLKLLEDAVRLLTDRKTSSTETHDSNNTEGVDASVVDLQLMQRMLTMLTIVARHEGDAAGNEESQGTFDDKTSHCWIDIRDTRKYDPVSASSTDETVSEVELVMDSGQKTGIVTVGRKRIRML